MARDRFLISLALALVIHALALFVVELIIRNQRARLPEYSGPLYVQLEEVPVIARSLPAAPAVVSEPPPGESAPPAEARPAAPAPGGGVVAAAPETAAPRLRPQEPLAAPATPEPAPPPPRTEPFVPEEVVIPPAGRKPQTETAGTQGAAPAVAPAAVMPLTDLDSALEERGEAGPAGEPDAGGVEGGAESGQARGTAPAAEAAGEGFLIQWEDPSQGREAIAQPLPVLPAWVSQQGLRLKTTVSFVLNPQGFLTEVKTEEGSGYSDVDAAVLEALRRWKFKPVASTRSVRGRVSYIIRPR
jgi:TonB family protein